MHICTYIFIYLKGRVKEGGRKRNIPYAGLLPKWTQQPGLGEAEARNKEFHHRHWKHQVNLLCHHASPTLFFKGKR